jgi:hypothetical protein
MMSGVPLETCWAFNKLWNNKFYYKLHLVGISIESYYDVRIHEYQTWVHVNLMPLFLTCYSELAFICYFFWFQSCWEITEKLLENVYGSGLHLHPCTVHVWSLPLHIHLCIYIHFWNMVFYFVETQDWTCVLEWQTAWHWHSPTVILNACKFKVIFPNRI